MATIGVVQRYLSLHFCYYIVLKKGELVPLALNKLYISAKFVLYSNLLGKEAS